MRKTIYSVAAATLLLFSTSASADVAQVWSCSLNDEFTGDWLEDGTTPGEALDAISAQYLAAARELDENASITVYFQIAGDAEEDTYIFVLTLPDFSAWGAFNDAYPGSAVAEVDSHWDDVGPCKTSTLWVTEDYE